MSGRRFGVAVTGAMTVAVCSCGSSPGAATATPSPTAAVLDACLVGSWKSTDISGTITVSGAPITLTGGAGELLTITSAGTVRTDDSATTPLTGTGTDGSTYKLVQSGTGTGTIGGTAGQLQVKLDQPTPVTVTLSKNGAVLQTQHPGSATDSYTCAPGASLVITGRGGTVIRYTSA